MILADTLKTLTSLTHHNIQMALGKACKEQLTGAKFLGMTNGGQLCYTVTYKVKGGTDSTKVFLTWDSASSQLSASY